MSIEVLISAILTASITGAGLILAIYALITPISSRIFEKRLERLHKKKREFDKLKKKISSESSEQEFKRLKVLGWEIKEMKAFPRYLGIGVSVVFWLYIVTAFYALGSLLGSAEQDAMRETIIIILFIFSTIGFSVVGSYAIGDVYRTMKGEFEQVKEIKESVEESVAQFERKLKEWEKGFRAELAKRDRE